MADNDKGVCEVVSSPVFREPGYPDPAGAPFDAEAWASLSAMAPAALRELGLRPWNDPADPEDDDGRNFGGGVLWLIPGEWYRHIPEGMALTCINGERTTFCTGETDNDIRFGCLAYGIVRPVGK